MGRLHMAAGGVDAALEGLPPDGTCDECEPDEAPEAERVCRECGFCYCRRHAELHGHRFPAHRLVQFLQGAIPAWTTGEAQGPAKKDLESESEEDEDDEEESDYETDEGTDRVASTEDSEEDMEDDQESETEEEAQDDEEGPREPRREFDPEIELEAETVAQRKCPEHGLDLSIYCQEDQQLICILCPVVGVHQGHQLTTLDEAFEDLQSKDSGRLKAAIIELVERLKFKTSDPNVSREEMKEFIQQEFKKVQKAIDDAEQRALHLVDVQEAMATAHVTEILADIQSHMDRLMTQIAQAKKQPDTSNESAELKAEGDEEEPSGTCEEEDT